MKWSVTFGSALQSSGQALVDSGHLQPEDIAVLFTAAVERLAKDATDFDSVHIAHSVCHMLMDARAPNPAQH